MWINSTKKSLKNKKFVKNDWSLKLNHLGFKWRCNKISKRNDRLKKKLNSYCKKTSKKEEFFIKENLIRIRNSILKNNTFIEKIKFKIWRWNL